MSQAEELLNSVSEEDIVPLLSNPETEPHLVIGDDRVIVVPDILKRLAVQYDHNIETVTFDCPRYWDEHDMSQMGIYINYRRKDRAPGSYRAKNIVVDEADPNIMHFDWTISRNVSLVVGKLQFLVCVKRMDDEGNEENHWNSELCEDCFVSEGLETGEIILEPYPDLVSQWAEDVEEVKAILLEARDNGEFDGFSPNVTIVDLEDKSGYRVVITDRYGANTFDIKHGSSATVTAVELEDRSGYRFVLTDAMDGAQIVDIKHGSAATATSVNIDGGHRLVLTDAAGGQTVIDIMDGVDGVDGFSPNVTLVNIDGGHRLVITDKSGANTLDIMDGKDGVDGFSPNVTVVPIEGGNRLVLTDQNGANTIDIMDGKDGTDGTDGVDGFSPTITVLNIEDGHRVVLTDQSGAKSVDIMDGVDGVDGTSSRIAVTETDGKRTVTITDADGVNSYDILDGEDGTDGVSPTISVEETSDGHTVTITDINGTQSFDVRDGSVDSLDDHNIDPTAHEDIRQLFKSATYTYVVYGEAGTDADYAATVDGITELEVGIMLLFIPRLRSTNTSPSLNINGLGAKTIKRRLSGLSSTVTSGSTDNWLWANKPQLLMYDGTYWIVINQDKPQASDLYGQVEPINGGTGVTSLEELAAVLTPYMSPRTAHGSYVGNGAHGSSNANQLIFDFTPSLVRIVDPFTGFSFDMDAVNCVTATYTIPSQGVLYDVSMTIALDTSNNTVSWYVSSVYDNTAKANVTDSTLLSKIQCNTDGVTYHYIAYG